MTRLPPQEPITEGEIPQIEGLLRALENQVQGCEQSRDLVQQLRQALDQRHILKQQGTSERDQAEEALRQNEQRFRSLFENNLDPVFWLTPQGRFGAINPAAEKLTGYSQAESREMSLCDLCVPECREETLRIFNMALSGDARPLETTICRKDGQRVDLWVAGGPIFVDGRLQGIFGVAKDITERRRAEQALRESRDRLALALEAGRAGLVYWDLRTNKVFWNRYAYEIHGYTEGAFEPTMEFWLSRVHPEDVAAVVAAIRRCTEHGIADISVEYRVLRPTDEVRWVRGVGRFEFDAAGVAQSFTGIALDTTQQRLAEARFSFLAEASALLASSLDPAKILSRLTRLSVPFLADFCVIYQIDSPETFHLVARTHLRIEWEPALDRIGERFRRIPTHPESRIAAAIRTGKAQLLAKATVEDCRHATQDPELLALWVKMLCHSAIIVPLAARGQTLGVLFLFMTESRRTYTAEDLRVAQELGARAAVALLHARLFADAQAARAEAEAANRAKDEFLAVLSHELRTPLTPVMTAVQMMECDPVLSPQQREWADMLQRNVFLEAHLIDDLLDVTRISRGKIVLHLAPVDLHLLVRHAAQTCQSEADAKEIRFRMELYAAHHHVRGDAARLQQVFWNLVKNAIKFTPRGGTITLRSEAVGEGQIAVMIQDTGVGIEPEILPHIFNAFEQGGAGTTRRFGGLGLGLAISRGLVDRHGGSLTASSAGRGQGATFTVQLAVLPGEEECSEAGADEGGAAVPPKTGRILLVEDHADTAATLARLLRSYGHGVDVAATVSGAIEKAGVERYDLVISDIGLPDGSGLDLMQQLVTLGSRRGIALSGYGMEEDIRRSREAGFAAHLTKPVNLKVLQDAIQEVLAAPAS